MEDNFMKDVVVIEQNTFGISVEKLLNIYNDCVHLICQRDAHGRAVSSWEDTVTVRQTVYLGTQLLIEVEYPSR